MATVHVTRRDGSEISFEAELGKSLMLNLRANGVPEVQAICGGCASCGTCHVYVGEEWLPVLPAMGEDEDETLRYSEHRRDNSRLACQIPLTHALDGLSVTVAPED